MTFGEPVIPEACFGQGSVLQAKLLLEKKQDSFGMTNTSVVRKFSHERN
jgi:hypothetical protein